MSHLKEREEKSCLNCNAVVYGRYCHVCGQENIAPKESVWHLFNHFFQDITHFHGKFFNSLKHLFLRPGFLSREYLLGRRASYLNPVRMYVFTSFFFFLIFFNVVDISKGFSKQVSTGKSKKTVSEIAAMDSMTYRSFIDEVVQSDSAMKFAYNKEMYLKYLDTVSTPLFVLKDSKAKAGTSENKDSAILKDKNTGWFKKMMARKNLQIRTKYKGDGNAVIKDIINNFFHSFPQLFFISLPLFALVLKLLYFRHKEYYYANHLIFSIHIYVFSFIIMLLSIGVNKLEEISEMRFLGSISTLITVGTFFYEYKAMRNFYQQRRAKTIVKFVLLNFLSLIVIMFLFLVFLLISIYKI